MKVISYIRVSTEEQARDGVSIDAQRAKIEAYCALYELSLMGVYLDPGVSGKSLERPALTLALSNLVNGSADGLVVAKLDRLTRSVRDMDHLISKYFGDRAKYGATLFSVADQVDTRTASGRLVLNVLMSVAQWERETIGERTRDALAHKRSLGKRISRRIPYGYQLSVDGESLDPSPYERRAIDRAKELYATGFTLRKIGIQLYADGFRPRNASAWHPSTINRLVNWAPDYDLR